MPYSDSSRVPPVTLGRTGVVSTRLGLGTAIWPRRVPFEQTVEMLRTAIDAGIRHIDTAPLYRTEEIIGRALQEIDLPTDLVLATKAGSYYDPELRIHYTGYRAPSIYRSVERSLKRLHTDTLDIVHVHDVRTEHLDQVFADDGALAALLDLKSQGVIRAVGMGTLGLDCTQAAVDSGDFDVIQIFHTYTLLNQSAADALLPAAEKREVAVLNSAPYAGYILATGGRPDARYNYAPASDGVIEAVRRIEAVCAEKGVDLPTAALAYAFNHPAVDAVVVASGNPKHVEHWVEALNAPLTREDFDEMLAAARTQFPLQH